MRRIIGVTGLKRSGKSEVCKSLEAHGFTVIGFADTLKEMALAIDPVISWGTDDRSPHESTYEFMHLAEAVDYFGWEIVKDTFPEARRFLQRLGTEGVRNHLGQDSWTNAWRAKVLAYESDADIAVPDVRFQNEADAVTSLGGQVWRVVRPNQDGQTQGPDQTQDLHPSEREQLSIPVSATIYNTDTLDYLRTQVRLQLSLPADGKSLSQLSQAQYPPDCECPEGSHVNDIVTADGEIRHQHDSQPWSHGYDPRFDPRFDAQSDPWADSAESDDDDDIITIPIHRSPRGPSRLMPFSAQRAVAEFHRVFRLPARDEPTVEVGYDVAELRQELIREEVAELRDAVLAGDLVGIADALADITYVVYGAALVYGIDLDSVIEEVHRSNMSKLDADGKPIFRADGKVLKSSLYSPPDIASVLLRSFPAPEGTGAEPDGLEPPTLVELVESLPPALHDAVYEVVDEAVTASRRFPPFNSAHEGFAVLAEEVDELWDEVRAKESARVPQRLRAEAKQASAMGLRFMVDITGDVGQ